MSICPNCGAAVPEGAVVCANCGAISLATSVPNIQTQATMEESNSSISKTDSILQRRLEKAMRRTELLTYAALGLGAALLAVIIIISLL